VFEADGFGVAFEGAVTLQGAGDVRFRLPLHGTLERVGCRERSTARETCPYGADPVYSGYGAGYLRGEGVHCSRDGVPAFGTARHMFGTGRPGHVSPFPGKVEPGGGPGG
jgi:hypothetical protein